MTPTASHDGTPRPAWPRAASAQPTVRHPILLVRHASTAWTGRRWCGRADPPLNAAGRREAAELATVLATELSTSTVLRSSPARRARSTAAAVAAAGLRVDIDHDLVEVDMGAADGLTWAEIERRHPDVAAAILAGDPVDWPGGESHIALATRVARAASRITAIARERPVVIVSHGWVLDRLLAELRVVATATDADDVARSLPPAGVLRLEPRTAR